MQDRQQIVLYLIYMQFATCTCFTNHCESNPVSRDCVLLRTNVNLLKRVPEHDSPTFFVLHRTKCKPMHSEWECSQTINVLHKTVREREKERAGGTERERESERERARERLQKGCAQIVQCTLVMFMPKPQMLYVSIDVYIA